MPKKTKTPQPELLNAVSERDKFQTPNYGTEILIPFLKKISKKITGFQVWEPACGLGKMVQCLSLNGIWTYGTDLQSMPTSINFITDPCPLEHFNCIVTNTPFSLKKKFYEKCREYNVPFALLMPADYSGWIIKAVQNGAEKIIPTRRIDYITPHTLQRIYLGEGHKYNSIYDVPTPLLRKYSSSDFHSMWLTWGFNLGRSETFVELTNEMKNNI
jgi:hypothetical protein